MEGLTDVIEFCVRGRSGFCRVGSGLTPQNAWGCGWQVAVLGASRGLSESRVLGKLRTEASRNGSDKGSSGGGSARAPGDRH